jgi:uncharacterized alkaline shock family protein YloU
MAKNVITKTQYGGIEVSNSAIATIAGNATQECYGVLGLVTKNQLRESIFEFLKVEEYNKGVYVRKSAKGYIVDLYIVCALDVKIPEGISEVQKKVKYTLEKTFKIKFIAVNVYVQDVKAA